MRHLALQHKSRTIHVTQHIKTPYLEVENEALCLLSGHKDFHQISIIGLNTLENMDPSFDGLKLTTDQQTVRTRK